MDKKKTTLAIVKKTREKIPDHVFRNLLREENNKKRDGKINNINHPNGHNCSCKSLNSNLTYCSNSCGCKRKGDKCTSMCICKGQCSNGKSISDELFFEVWRNIVIRQVITGDDRVNKIREMNKMKSKVLIELAYNGNLQYRNHTIDRLLSISSITAKEIVQVEIENLKKERKQQLYFILKENGLDFRKSNETFQLYVNSITTQEQIKLKPILMILEEEKKYQHRKQLIINKLSEYGISVIRDGNLHFKLFMNNGTFPFKHQTLNSIVQEEVDLLSIKTNGNLRRALIIDGLKSNGIKEFIPNLSTNDYINGNVDPSGNNFTFDQHLNSLIQYFITLEYLRCPHCGNIHN